MQTSVSLPQRCSKLIVNHCIKHIPLVVLEHIIRMVLLNEILKQLRNGFWPTCYILLIIGQPRLMSASGFWPQAIEYAWWVFNRMPNLANGLLPNEILSSWHAPTEESNCSHMFSCLVYVLDTALQDGHKMPKWAPGTRLGTFLGFLTLFIPGVYRDECRHGQDLS